jgi:hypothetical protein
MPWCISVAPGGACSYGYIYPRAHSAGLISVAPDGAFAIHCASLAFQQNQTGSHTANASPRRSLVADHLRVSTKSFGAWRGEKSTATNRGSFFNSLLAGLSGELYS